MQSSKIPTQASPSENPAPSSNISSTNTRRKNASHIPGKERNICWISGFSSRRVDRSLIMGRTLGTLFVLLLFFWPLSLLSRNVSLHRGKRRSKRYGALTSAICREENLPRADSLISFQIRRGSTFSTLKNFFRHRSMTPMKSNALLAFLMASWQSHLVDGWWETSVRMQISRS